MGAVLVPILPGKLDEWREDVAELSGSGSRAAEFRDLNQRHGLTEHRAWLAPMPDGSNWVIAVHDGPGGDTFLQNIAASDHPFDLWFKDHIGRVHGLDFDKPPEGPLPELYLDEGQ